MPTHHARRRSLIVDIPLLIAYALWELLDNLAERLTDQAERVTAWARDLTPSERRHQAVRLTIDLALVAGVVIACTACQPPSDPPGPLPAPAEVTVDGVRVVQP